MACRLCFAAAALDIQLRPRPPARPPITNIRHGSKGPARRWRPSDAHVSLRNLCTYVSDLETDWEKSDKNGHPRESMSLQNFGWWFLEGCGILWNPENSEKLRDRITPNFHMSDVELQHCDGTIHLGQRSYSWENSMSKLEPRHDAVWQFL